MPDIVEIDGKWWPASDKWAHRIIPKEVGPSMAWLESHNVKRGSVVQAGGNVGLYADALCDLFGKVVTAEPDRDNFVCSLKNTQHRLARQWFPYHAALGSEPGTCHMVEHDPGNCGAHRVEDGGDIRTMTIDEICENRRVSPDVIWLDIEGHELQALRGAVKTLKAHKPLVIVELKGLGGLYGYEDSAVHDFLEDQGYSFKSKHENDFMFSSHMG